MRSVLLCWDAEVIATTAMSSELYHRAVVAVRPSSAFFHANDAEIVVATSALCSCQHYPRYGRVEFTVIETN